jgi:hypothetical protein
MLLAIYDRPSRPTRRRRAGDRRPGGNQVAQHRAVVIRVVVSPRQPDRRADAVQQIDEVLPLLGCQLTVTDRSGQRTDLLMGGGGFIDHGSSLHCGLDVLTT